MATAGKNHGRRGFLVLAGGAGLLIGLPRFWQSLAPLPGAEPHPDVPGFYRLETTKITAPADPFIGLERARDIIAPAPIPDPCTALYDGPIPAGRVPVAFFTDINCPYCRMMEPRIAALSPDRVAVTWHDLPLLGEASVAAARAIAAAEMQGAATALRARLTRTRFQPDQAYLTALASGVGIDADRLATDMTSDDVTQRIATSLGLAALFGIFGTPALVVGHTLAIGNRTSGQIETMIDSAETGPGACG